MQNGNTLLWDADNNIPEMLKTKPREVREQCIAVANKALLKGLSKEDALFACISRLKVIEKSNAPKKAVKQVPEHVAALFKSRAEKPTTTVVNKGVSALFLPKNKLVADKQRNIIGAEFDKQGRLVLQFDTGEKLVTNQAPADQITQNTTVVVKPSSELEEEVLAKRIDFITENLFYKGEASPGTANSDALWRISQVQIAVDGDVTEIWAEGSGSFDKVWDDRATYSYI